jgi:hypothetical protein
MNLTAQDYANVVQIVDIMTARGAIRGDELTAIATIRQRFLEAAQAGGAMQQPQAEEPKEEEK